MFAEKLKRAMRELNLNQSDLAVLLGISKASISQYLTGRQVPPDKRKKQFAELLGLDSQYFLDPIQVVPVPQQTGAIPRLSTEMAANLMGMAPRTIQLGLQQGVFPWGYAVKTTENRWTYFINAKRFAEIEGVQLDL